MRLWSLAHAHLTGVQDCSDMLSGESCMHRKVPCAWHLSCTLNPETGHERE